VDAAAKRVARSEIGSIKMVASDDAAYGSVLASYPAAVGSVLRETGAAMGIDIAKLLRQSGATDADPAAASSPDGPPKRRTLRPEPPALGAPTPFTPDAPRTARFGQAAPPITAPPATPRIKPEEGGTP
jgi:hypothetical protein